MHAFLFDRSSLINASQESVHARKSWNPDVNVAYEINYEIKRQNKKVICTNMKFRKISIFLCVDVAMYGKHVTGYAAFSVHAVNSYITTFSQSQWNSMRQSGMNVHLIFTVCMHLLVSILCVTRTGVFRIRMSVFSWNSSQCQFICRSKLRNFILRIFYKMSIRQSIRPKSPFHRLFEIFCRYILSECILNGHSSLFKLQKYFWKKNCEEECCWKSGMLSKSLNTWV